MEETPFQLIRNLNLDEGDTHVDLEPNNKKSYFAIPCSITTSLNGPNFMSIGPIHYDKPHLKRMQSHKKRAVIHFIKRSGKPKEFYFNKLKDVLGELRETYKELELKEGQWKDDDEFVALILLDGIFLLEFLSVLRGPQRSHDYPSSDPIFGLQGHISIYDSVMPDLLLLDNQLPYFALHTLLSAYLGVREEIVDSTLNWLISTPKNEPVCLRMFDTNRTRSPEPEGTYALQSNDITGRQSESELHKPDVLFKRVHIFNGVKFDNNTVINLFTFMVLGFVKKRLRRFEPSSSSME